MNTCFKVAISSEGTPSHGGHGATGLTIADISAFNNRSFRISGHYELSATFDCVEPSYQLSELADSKDSYELNVVFCIGRVEIEIEK